MKFNKPPLTIAQQLQRWQGRGLTVAAPARALHYLKFIGYYRLSAYALPFQQPGTPVVAGQPDKPFVPGTSFEDILNLYVFDRELRLLVMDAMERIEVAVRTSLVNELCLLHGAHWFMEARHFNPRFNHGVLLDKIERELDIPRGANQPRGQHHETFINHYYQVYGDPYLPPAWMVAETLPLGSWSMVFANLQQSSERRAVATPFGVDEQVLRTWLHSLTYLRNLCAHHARLWNRQFVIKPMIARKHTRLLTNNGRFYAFAVILHDFLKTIAPGTMWAHRLADLLRTHPRVPMAAMGFPSNWQAEAFWGLTPPAPLTPPASSGPLPPGASA
ncbi:MAG: Abi family protein [Limisphaerales bacterium]